MSWWSVGIGTVVTIWGSNKADERSDKAKKDADKHQTKAEQLAQDRLDLERQAYEEQKAEWDATFGPVAKNLSNFYSTLTPESIIAVGLTNQKKVFDEQRSQLATTLAKRGIDAPAIERMLEGGIDIAEAESEARLRNQAPLQVAQAKQGFLATGQRASTSGISAALGKQAELELDLFARDRKDQLAAEETRDKGLGNLGTILGTGLGKFLQQDTLDKTPETPRTGLR